MENIIVPQIEHNWKILKEEQVYTVKDWINWNVWKILDLNIESNWFEWEWFILDEKWDLVLYDKVFKTMKTQTDDYLNNLQYIWDNEESLNNSIKDFDSNSNFWKEEANITQELFLPAIEISFNKWYSVNEIFNKVIWSYADLIKYLESQNLTYFPWWNYPIEVRNINNYANEYYKYLFSERDGFHIGDFRWTWLQLHKMMDNYELSIYTFNKIRHLLPIFNILTQNSPIMNWLYKWNLSERTVSKYDWKMTWIPDTIDNNFILEMQDWLNSSIKTVTPYYYAVRYPRVDIKTIENAAMDTVSDVTILIAVMDLYYRITEKLKKDFIESNPLPKELFWIDTWTSIETNVIRENYNRGVRYWTQTKLHIFWQKDYNFWNLLDELFKYIEDIPSCIPNNMKLKLWFSNDIDITSNILFDVVKNWNLAEKTVKELWLTLYKWDSIIVNSEEIKKIMLEQSKTFSNQIKTIIS